MSRPKTRKTKVNRQNKSRKRSTNTSKQKRKPADKLIKAKHPNLIPFNERTQEEHREIARMGGIKSGEVRREKRRMRELANEILSQMVIDDNTKTFIADNGFEVDDTSYKEAMIIAQLLKAIHSGDTSAYKALEDTIGENPRTMDLLGIANDQLSQMEKVLEGFEKLSNSEPAKSWDPKDFGAAAGKVEEGETDE